LFGICFRAAQSNGVCTQVTSSGCRRPNHSRPQQRRLRGTKPTQNTPENQTKLYERSGVTSRTTS
jgi:hypothetical protein